MGAPFTTEQLQDAIKTTDAEIARIESDAARQVKKLQARGDMFREMLAEMKPASTGQNKLDLGAQAEPPDVRTFLSKVMADGKPREVQELVQRAKEAGLLKASASPGRSVHAVMMGMMQNGIVKRENDMWVKASP